MKHIFLLVVSTILITACNNSTDNNSQSGTKKPKTEADSLEQEIEDGHLVGMSKMGKLTRLQQQTAHIIDSISKLPARAKQAAMPLKAKLETLLKELDYADMAMNKWMSEYKMDSAIGIDAKARLNYLISENNKVSKLKEAILSGIAHADSVYHRN